MSKLLIACIAIVSLVYSLYFFYKAAGTFDLGKLNIIHVAGIFFFLQSFLGIVMIQLGINQHHTLNRLIDRQGSLMVTFFVVMVYAVVFPCLLCLFLKLFRVDAKKDYEHYMKDRAIYRPKKILFYLTLAASVACLGLLALFFMKLGYIPLWKMVFHDSSFNLGTERILITGAYVINSYVTNIGIHLAIPLIAYFAFACALSTREVKWIALAVVMFIAGGLVKTYNFAKVPIVFFLLTYLCILIYFRGGIKMRWLILFGAAGIGLLFLIYTIQGTKLNMSIIYGGIWGRIFFTEVGTLSYNFDLFPKFLPFLKGRSLSMLLIRLLGLPFSEQLRSARLLMEFYGADSVYNGTGGVMNSLYLGEAYANFGWIGMVLATVWVAFLFAAFFAVVLKSRKTPAMITLFAFFTVAAPVTCSGGFVDFIYNFTWIVTIIAMVVCHKFFFEKDPSAPLAR